MVGKSSGAVDFVIDVDPADAHGADRVAVVGVVEGDELGLLAVAPPKVLLVLEGHLDGDFHSGGAVVGVEHLV